jgi:hypothetical protein
MRELYVSVAPHNTSYAFATVESVRMAIVAIVAIVAVGTAALPPSPRRDRLAAR